MSMDWDHRDREPCLSPAAFVNQVQYSNILEGRFKQLQGKRSPPPRHHLNLTDALLHLVVGREIVLSANLYLSELSKFIRIDD